MATKKDAYPASLDIEYPGVLDRFTTFFRILWFIPVAIILGLVSASGGESAASESGKEMSSGGAGIVGGLFAATILMIVFREKYPRWWFDFALEFTRFSTRVGTYLFLMTDKYPSTTDSQSVKLEVVYPNVKKLNRWLPIVKWFLALPHYFVLIALFLAALVGVVIAWFAILFTGQYPRSIFDFMLGVGRWYLRVYAYAFLLVTDEYPPFSLK